MKFDLDAVSVEPIEIGGEAFRGSLSEVLARVAPMAAATPGLSPEEHIRRLGDAINLVLATLDELTGIVDEQRLPRLIERISELAVTGDNLEVQIGVAGDLRVDKHRRLMVDNVLVSLDRVPANVRPAAVREGIASLRRLLALLLLHGWTEDMGDDPEARQAARQSIVDTVQGRQYAGQPAL